MNTPEEQAELSDVSRSSGRGKARPNSPGRLNRTIFAALLAVIALVAVPYGTVEPWWQALFECAVFVLAALWLIDGFMSTSHSFSAYRIFLPLVALALFGLLQTIPFATNGPPLMSGATVWHTLSADPHETRLWVSRMLALILVGAMLTRYTRNSSRLRALIFLVISVAVASAVFGLLRKTMQHDLGFVLPYLRPGFGYGQFINNNHFAFLMEMALGLTLGLCATGSVRRDRLPLYLGAALMMGMSLVLSTSRGGVLTMLCQFILIALLFPSLRPIRESRKPASGVSRSVERVFGSFILRALLILSLVVTVSVGIVWVGGDPLMARLEAIPGEVGTREVNARWGERRIEIWKSTWQLIKAHPIAGVGMAGYWTAIPQYHDASGEFTPQRAHNDYLELLASGGLIGLLLGAWFIVVFAKAARRQLRTTDSFRRAASFAALVGIVGVSVHSFVDFGLHITVNAVLLIVLVVIATVDLPPKNHEPSVPTK